MTPEQIEIERKKFEKLHEARGWNIERLKSGSYVFAGLESKFNAWLACCESRESLCVTLPSIKGKTVSYIEAVDDFKSMLQSASINYREEE